MDAKEVLLTATDTIVQRGLMYGHPSINQQRIADRWTQLFQTPIADYEAALAMIEVKMSRIIESPTVEDHYIDLCGYAAIACQLATEAGGWD